MKTTRYTKCGFLLEIITPIISTKQRRTSDIGTYTVKYTYDNQVRKYNVKRVNHESTKQKLGDIGGSGNTDYSERGINQYAGGGDV